MFIQIAMRAVEGTLLFRDWIEARALWDRLISIIGLRAMVLMPTHNHVMVPSREVRSVREAARSYAMWRNHHRGENGRVWQLGSQAVPFLDNKHLRRTLRYFLLNPCRADLVDDPLRWPFSTHRDMVGLAWPPKLRAKRNPRSFHAWISADATVDPAGTSLPTPPDPEFWPRTSLHNAKAAVSAITRTPHSALMLSGPARTLMLRAARALTDLSLRQIGKAFGVHASTVSRAAQSTETEQAMPLVMRVLGDARFPLLTDEDLPWLNPDGTPRYRR